MKYFQRRRKEKLYRQWVERAGLPPEAITVGADKPESEEVPARVGTRKGVIPKTSGPVQVQPGSSAVTHAEVGGDMMAEIKKRQPRLPRLYMSLGAALVILFVGVILLIVHSC